MLSVMRRLKINQMDLEEAFEAGFSEMHYYLDTETGKVLMVQDESRRELERLKEEAGSDDKLEHLLRDSDLPDWQKQALVEAQKVEDDFGTCVVGVPEQEGRDGFREMAAFVTTVPEPRLRAELQRCAPRTRRLSPVQGCARKRLPRAGTLVPIQA